METDVHKQLTVITGGSAAAAQAAAVFARCMRERCPVEVGIDTAGGFQIELVLSSDIQDEAYIVKNRREGCASARGCSLGLVYGLGKLLRDGTCGAAGFIPGTWRGLAQPALPVHGDLFCHPFP